MELPLLEDDLNHIGIIEPSKVISPIDMPPTLVLCFFREVVDAIAERPDAHKVETLVWAHGEHPIWEIEHRGKRLGVLLSSVGAPVSAGLMEESIALGASTIVAVGGAGALIPELVLGHAIIVESALRDEGTSFHYLTAGRTVDADSSGVAALEQTLREAGVQFVKGRTWTTDAPYRETVPRTERRVAEGCITVEMEAAACIAVAKFRDVRFAQLLYAGDSLAGSEWDDRGWSTATSIREQLFWHAADACLTLAGD